MPFRGSYETLSSSSDSDFQTGFFKGLAICTTLVFIVQICCCCLGIAKLAIGGTHFNHCALQPLLPLFLIIDTVGSFAFTLLTHGVRELVEQNKRTVTTYLQRLFGAFQVAWLVCGTLWVVEVRDIIYAPGHCENSTESFKEINHTIQIVVGEMCVTCNEVLADFTFATIILEWILVGLHVLLFIVSLLTTSTCFEICA